MNEGKEVEAALLQYKETLRKVIYMNVKDMNKLLYNGLLDRHITRKQPLNAGLMFMLPDGSRYRIVLTIERLQD